jgi:hypothetical protein
MLIPKVMANVIHIPGVIDTKKNVGINTVSKVDSDIFNDSKVNYNDNKKTRKSIKILININHKWLQQAVKLSSAKVKQSVSEVTMYG